MAGAVILLGGTDGLDLTRARAGSAAWGYKVMAEGFDVPGSPQAVIAVIASLLLDGSAARRVGDGNIELKFRVKVEGATPDDALSGAQELALAVRSGRTTLSLALPGVSRPSVYDVMVGDLDLVKGGGQDVRWTQSAFTYEIKLTCLPGARPTTKTVVSVARASGAVTSLDTGASAASWQQASVSPLPVAFTGGVSFMGDSSAVRVALPDAVEGESGYAYCAVEWTGTVGSGASYLAVDVSSQGDASMWVPVELRIGGNTWEEAAKEVGSRSAILTGYRRALLPYNGGVPRLWFKLKRQRLTSNMVRRFNISALGKTAELGTNAGVYTMPVGGSMRSAATVRRSGGTTRNGLYVDPTMITFDWSPLLVSTFPQAPRGRYMAYLSRSFADGDVVTLTATNPAGTAHTERTVIPATALGGDASVRTAAGVPIGEFTLGSTETGLMGAITWTGTLNGSSMALNNGAGVDWLVLLRMDDDTAFCSVADVAATFEAPSIDNLFGGVWIGGQDATDKVKAWHDLVVTPPFTPICPFPALNAAETLTMEWYERHATYVTRAS